MVNLARLYAVFCLRGKLVLAFHYDVQIRVLLFEN